jgi:hypothetical protein
MIPPGLPVLRVVLPRYFALIVMLDEVMPAL